MTDAVIEKKRSSNAGIIAAIVVIALIVLATIFIVPGLMGGAGTPAPALTTSQ